MVTDGRSARWVVRRELRGLYEETIPLLVSIATDGESFRDLRSDEDAQLTASEPAIAERVVTIEEVPDVDPAVVTIPDEEAGRRGHRFADESFDAVHPMALHDSSCHWRGLSFAGMARPVHFEIHADDPERAIAFYTAVFGWTVNQWEDNPYWLVSTGPTDQPGIDGAILPRVGDRPAHGAPIVGMVNTMQVEDLDAALATAFDRGGLLALDKTVIAGVGTVAYVLDSEANVIGMLQPED